jgi:phosphohistidine phosphatase
MAADQGIRNAIRALGPYSGKATVAVVGHEPNLSELASYLLTGGGDVAPIQMKKGGVACLSIDGRPAPRSASLRFLATPKLLRALDRSR